MSRTRRLKFRNAEVAGNDGPGYLRGKSCAEKELQKPVSSLPVELETNLCRSKRKLSDAENDARVSKLNNSQRLHWPEKLPSSIHSESRY